MKDSLSAILISLIALAALPMAEEIPGQILRVDSVAVDSVWVSDSAGRQSRDCKISFFPRGEGMARMFIAFSVDSAKTWEPSPGPLIVMNNALSSSFMTGRKATITARVLGGDRPGVAFRMTARQAAPAIAGKPKWIIAGGISALSAGQNISVKLGCSLTSVNSGNGYCTLDKVYWDALGDGTINDSTTGAGALSWTWPAQVPAGASGQQRGVIVRAKDKNGLWSVPETLAVQFGLKKPIAMKNISAGTFTMGATGIAVPIHQVKLSAFSIQETEVTQEQYLAVTGVNPASFDTGADAALRPVENVSWYDAVRFCNVLSVLAGKIPVYDTTVWRADFSKNGYRLPTEAEWEYACSAGSTTAYWWGADTSGMGARAWTGYNSNGTTHAVAAKLANAWGQYDMAGNVWEWCNDWHDAYPSTIQTDPAGAATGSLRVMRGGAWDAYYDSVSFLLSAYRGRNNPDLSDGYTGFRCVCR